MVLLPTAFVPRHFDSDGILQDWFIYKREVSLRTHREQRDTESNKCTFSYVVSFCTLHAYEMIERSSVCSVKCSLAKFWAALGLYGTPGERLWIALFLWTNLAWGSLNSRIQFVILLLKVSLRYMLIGLCWGGAEVCFHSPRFACAPAYNACMLVHMQSWDCGNRPHSPHYLLSINSNINTCLSLSSAFNRT